MGVKRVVLLWEINISYKYWENIVLKKILGPRHDEENEQFKMLHNEEFRDLYRSPGEVRTAGILIP